METCDLTLLLPTHNRCGLFARLLQHLANSRWQGPIIIADSSNNGIWEKNEEAANRHRNVLQIEYVRYLPSTSAITKWANAASRVKSEYALFCADDDLIVTDAVLESASFLSQNPEYSICHGVYLAYTCNIPGDPASGFKIVSDNYSDSLEQENASERLVALFSKYTATFYGVHRTASLNAIFNKICDCLPASLAYGCLQELVQTCLVVVHGKVKRLPILYSVRKGWPSSAGWETVLTKRDFSIQLDAVRAVILDAVVEREAISRDETVQLFDAAFIRYLRKGIGFLSFPKQLNEYESKDFGSARLDTPSIRMLLEDAGPAYGSIDELIQKSLAD